MSLLESISTILSKYSFSTDFNSWAYTLNFCLYVYCTFWIISNFTFDTFPFLMLCDSADVSAFSSSTNESGLAIYFTFSSDCFRIFVILVTSCEMLSSSLLAPTSSKMAPPNLCAFNGLNSSIRCFIYMRLSSTSSCKSIQTGGKFCCTYSSY